MKKLLLYFYLLIPIYCFSSLNDYPLLPPQIKKVMARYLIEETHPLKPVLDAIFNEPKVLWDDAHLVNASFALYSIQETSHVRVAFHPLAPGYIFKIYPNTELEKKKGLPGYIWLTKRCIGAERIRRLIKKHKINHFVVPDKYLYAVPYDPAIPLLMQQPIILVATDMQLVSREENRQAWYNANEEVLDELYLILKHGSGSYFLTGNVPYTRSGKFAFIDTEYPKRKISMEKAANYFSPAMQKYWEKLLKKG